jgi:hypothetical protein
VIRTLPTYAKGEPKSDLALLAPAHVTLAELRADAEDVILASGATTRPAADKGAR